MKKVLLALGVLTIVSSQVMAAENKTAIGVGAGVSLSPYQGVGTETNPIPFFDIRYEQLYVKGIEVGFDFWSNDNLTASVFINPFGGYEVDGSDLDAGFKAIDNRDYQYEGGLKVSYDTGWYDTKVGAFLALGEEGDLGGINVLKRFPITDNFSVTPKLYLDFLSEDYTDYYFGVTSAEAASNAGIASSYGPDTTFRLGLKVAGEFTINQNWSAVGFVGLEQLGEEVEDSPIVEEDLLYSVGVGAKYTFTN